MLCIASLVFLVVQLQVALAGVIGCAPSSQSFTIKTAQDVSDIVTCATFTGNLVVAADGPEEISLDGITTISGNLDVENVAQLRSLSSQTLTAVSSFTLNNLPKLSNLSFPSLTNFSSIKWHALPALENAGVTPGKVDSEVQEVTIFNTSIKSLDWITWPLGGLLNLTANANLKNFAIPYATINTGSTITLSQNTILENLTMSQLTGIYGALQMSQNPKLESLDIANLETIGGYVQLSGSFTNITMSTLNKVNGALHVTSTGDISTFCTYLDQKAASSKGHYDCSANLQDNPTASTAVTATTTATGTSTATLRPPPNDNSNALPTGAKIAIGIVIPLVAIVSSILTCICFRRRLRSKVKEIEKNNNNNNAKEDPETPSSSENPFEDLEPKELGATGLRVEIGPGREISELETEAHARELAAWHGKSELETPITPLTPAESWLSGNGSQTRLVRHELPG